MSKDNIKTEIVVKEQKISILRIDNKEYISLTDLARYVNKDDPSGVIRNFILYGKKLIILILIPWNPT